MRNEGPLAAAQLFSVVLMLVALPACGHASSLCGPGPTTGRLQSLPIAPDPYTGWRELSRAARNLEIQLSQGDPMQARVAAWETCRKVVALQQFTREIVPDARQRFTTSASLLAGDAA